MRARREVDTRPCCDLKPSKVHGKGIFAVRDLEKGKRLFETHSSVADVMQWVNLVPNCSYNHSDEPNCGSVTDGKWKYLVTLRDIKEGEELTEDYRTLGTSEDVRKQFPFLE